MSTSISSSVRNGIGTSRGNNYESLTNEDVLQLECYERREVLGDFVFLK